MVKDNSLYIIAIVAVVAVVGLVIMATGSTVVVEDSIADSDDEAIAGQATWAVMNAEGYALQHGSSACPELTDVENACGLNAAHFSIEAAPDYHLPDSTDLSQTTCTPCVVQYCNHVPSNVPMVWSSNDYHSTLDAYNAALAYAQDQSNDFSMFYAPWMSSLEIAHCNDVNSDSTGVTADTDDSTQDDSSGRFELELEFRGTIDMDEGNDDKGWTLERSDKIFDVVKSPIRVVVPADSVQSFIEIDQALRQDTTREDLPEYELIVPQACDGDWVPKNVETTVITSLAASRLTAMDLTAKYSNQFCSVRV